MTVSGYAAFSASDTGVIAYAKPIGLSGDLRWFDRSGNPAGSVGHAARLPRFRALAGRATVAVSRVDPKLTSADVWLLDLARNVTTRFTVDPRPMPAHCGRPMADELSSGPIAAGSRSLSEAIERHQPEHPILDPTANLISSDWSSDGKFIVYTKTSSTGGFDIWVWPIDATPNRNSPCTPL